MSEVVIHAENVANYLGGRWIHKALSMHVKRGEIVAIVGGSGSGKTTLLRSILRLLVPQEGTIQVFGVDMLRAEEAVLNQVRRRWGVLFQQGALFSSLTVLENLMFPLREFTDLSSSLRKELALLKLYMTGLQEEAAHKYPAELSGGMLKRASIARAIAMDPELVFLDEPTSGLDPKSASSFDELILHLRDTLGLTIVMITHDLDSLWRISDRVAFIGEQTVLAQLPIAELVEHEHPAIRDYFKSTRGLAHEKRES